MLFPSSVMHLKKADRNHYILFCTLFVMIINRNLVSCKPIVATEEIVVDDEADATTAEPNSNIRIDTLVKATEAVQQFQKMLNEQMLTLKNDEIIISTDVALTILPDQTVGTTAEPHLHKHRHSKSHHRDGYHHHRRKDNGDDSSTNEQIFDDDHQLRETQRRFNSQTNFVANPYECPRINGKATQLLCPSRRRHGYHVCVDETALCNGHNDCPNGEDENPTNCMFYKMTMRYFKTVVDQVVQLSEHVLQNSRRRNNNNGEEL